MNKTTGRGAGTRLADWRIPAVEPLTASILTGLVCGVTVTGAGALLLAAFDSLRGRPTGGGMWGSISIAALVVACGVLGAWLLGSFGAGQPAATSVLAVAFTLMAELTAFADLSHGPWAPLVVPGVITFSYFAAGYAMALAESSGDVR